MVAQVMESNVRDLDRCNRRHVRGFPEPVSHPRPASRAVSIRADGRRRGVDRRLRRSRFVRSVVTGISPRPRPVALRPLEAQSKQERGADLTHL